ncbi:hypothetical protein PFISCL1PPCAC_10447 [Pristionchus fissidentatus]|uniref:Phospholipid-transporting ATPase n=1 Tax=Pristionchus fissidentatus TaxID=1538716 RepID=A0AAV5VKK9_9BILA|nr:hypothetical protein PFISCL1PPCAC_10447 [Pristionchus fissidentatus]
MSPYQEKPSTSSHVSTLPSGASGRGVKGHHRRTSSLWIPPSRPTFYNPGESIRQTAEDGGKALKQLVPPFMRRFLGEKRERGESRTVIPNNEKNPPARFDHPSRKYADNRISTTKYSLLTFLPKNLFEQLHRAANIYFIFIIILNMIIEAFGRYISMLPIAFVLLVTAVKDAFEDYQRYRSDIKINHQTCRVWDSSQGRYRKMEWKNILVGDFVHLSHDEIIPADILLLKSSAKSGTCYVETSNLDGESNLKQRQVARAMGKYHSLTCEMPFSPDEFNYRVVVEAPCTDVYKFDGHLESPDGFPPIARDLSILGKDNVLLRGCAVRNTDFVEGIVLYAGSDTKAMLNNSGPRYKRSQLEKMTNWDIIWCVLILLALCTTGAVLSGVWLASFDNPLQVPFLTYPTHPSPTPSKPTDLSTTPNPAYEAFINFWSYIIVLQVMIPISLYVSIEIIKLGQIYFLSQDVNLYYEKVDKRIQCRALNIPEELGQIEYVMSDKTGTLTENEMIFRRCSVIGKDFGGQSIAGVEGKNTRGRQGRHSKDRALETLLATTVKASDVSSPLYSFFVALSICNTVVVNARPHEDTLDSFGDIIVEEREEEERAEREDKAEMERDRQQGAYHNVQFDVREEMETEMNERSTSSGGDTVHPDMIELSDLSGSDDKKKEEKKGEEKKEEGKKEKKGILAAHSRHSLISLARLQRFKDVTQGPFRRIMDKRASTTTLPDIPPPISFYDSESPDELALVEAAKEYGVRLMRRHFEEVTIHMRPSGQYVKYKILHVLPFDADRKRMSVIVRETFNQSRLVLLTKGADATILPVLSQEWSESEDGIKTINKAQEHLSDYAREGLRTLCICRRYLDEEDYAKWKILHEEAELDPHHKENLLRESFERMERDLELIGVTAIEDRLQDGVADTIDHLRRAGIHVWVLTGDKVETAVNIAYSSKLFSQSMHLLNLSSTGVTVVSDLLDIHLARVNSVEEVTSEGSFGLVINAVSLEYCIHPDNIDRFCQLLRKCESVLCCRATPLQKASLVRLTKQNLKAKVLAIGDGANDVSMIQGADVGVGLSGQEGMQAVMASDFALARFRFLSRLLLVHGHWCYHRLALVILYFFYKNAMFVLCIFWYQIFNGFSSQVPIDPIYLMVYNFLFTSLPSLIFGFLEQDGSSAVLLSHPILYDHGILNKKYRWYSFWLNMVDALWQSAAVYFIAHFTFIDAECDMWTFGILLCTQLLFVNSLHLASIVQLWTIPMVISIVGSIILFFFFALMYNLLVTPEWAVKDTPSLIAERAVIDVRFWLVVLLSSIIALLPRFIYTITRNSIFPSRLITAKMEEKSRNRVKSSTVQRP